MGRFFLEWLDSPPLTAGALKYHPRSAGSLELEQSSIRPYGQAESNRGAREVSDGVVFLNICRRGSAGAKFEYRQKEIGTSLFKYLAA